jgi:hypothetical protein
VDGSATLGAAGQSIQELYVQIFVMEQFYFLIGTQEKCTHMFIKNIFSMFMTAPFITDQYCNLPKCSHSRMDKSLIVNVYKGALSNNENEQIVYT